MRRWFYGIGILSLVALLAGLLGPAQAAQPLPRVGGGTHSFWVPVPALDQQIDCNVTNALPPVVYQADSGETHYEARLLVRGQGRVSLSVSDPPVSAQAVVNSADWTPLTLAVDLPSVPAGGVTLNVTFAGPDCTTGSALFARNLNLRVGP
jgi:hypothetical protein